MTIADDPRINKVAVSKLLDHCGLMIYRDDGNEGIIYCGRHGEVGLTYDLLSDIEGMGIDRASAIVRFAKDGPDADSGKATV